MVGLQLDPRRFVAVVGVDSDRQTVLRDPDAPAASVDVPVLVALEVADLGVLVPEKPQQVVERVVLHHEHDDVLDPPVRRAPTIRHATSHLSLVLGGSTIAVSPLGNAVNVIGRTPRERIWRCFPRRGPG